jgi:hypothetical protein
MAMAAVSHSFFPIFRQALLRTFIHVFLSARTKIEMCPGQYSRTFFPFVTNCETMFPRGAGRLTADVADFADERFIMLEGQVTRAPYVSARNGCSRQDAKIRLFFSLRAKPSAKAAAKPDHFLIMASARVLACRVSRPRGTYRPVPTVRCALAL